MTANCIFVEYWACQWLNHGCPSLIGKAGALAWPECFTSFASPHGRGMLWEHSCVFFLWHAILPVELRQWSCKAFFAKRATLPDPEIPSVCLIVCAHSRHSGTWRFKLQVFKRHSTNRAKKNHQKTKSVRDHVFRQKLKPMSHRRICCYTGKKKKETSRVQSQSLQAFPVQNRYGVVQLQRVHYTLHIGHYWPMKVFAFKPWFGSRNA